MPWWKSGVPRSIAGRIQISGSAGWPSALAETAYSVATDIERGKITFDESRLIAILDLWRISTNIELDSGGARGE